MAVCRASERKAELGMNGGTPHRFRVISRSYDLGIFRNFPNERTWMFFVWVMFLLLILSKLWKMNEHLASEDVWKSLVKQLQGLGKVLPWEHRWISKSYMVKRREQQVGNGQIGLFFLKCPHFRDKVFIARTLEVFNPYHGMMVGVLCHTSVCCQAYLHERKHGPSHGTCLGWVCVGRGPGWCNQVACEQ